MIKSLAIDLSAQPLPSIPSPEIQQWDGTESSNPLITCVFPWQSNHPQDMLRTLATSHLIRTQKTLSSSETTKSVGALCQELGRRTGRILYSITQLKCFLKVFLLYCLSYYCSSCTKLMPTCVAPAMFTRGSGLQKPRRSSNAARSPWKCLDWERSQHGINLM